MKPNHSVINAAIAGLQTLGTARDGTDMEQCHGVAGVDRYDCGSAIHSCANRAGKDGEPAEWKHVAKGSCRKLGGQPGAPSRG